MVRTGPAKPEATEAVTCTGEVTVALLSGVVMVTPPLPVREAVRSLEACRCWKKATAPAARTRTTARTIYWMKPRWRRGTREEFIRANPHKYTSDFSKEKRRVLLGRL